MKFPYYTGKPGNRREKPAQLPSSLRAGLEDPSNYLPDPGLVDAMNVALLLGQPLLLTGEPGVGKTQFAYSVAWELGFDTPPKFEAKSTSVARDFFYTYDTVGRFHAAQTKEGSQNPLDYITYRALGKAILLANERENVARWLPEDFQYNGPRRSVVLVDEIDKTPRDFPNDILNEVEEMYFRVPELKNAEIHADKSMRPILIITSNSEKHLPDAFLRRCIYYNIPFPSREQLIHIIAARIGRFICDSSQFLEDALDLFFRLREDRNGLRKKPATAELLGWLLYLRKANEDVDNPLRQKIEIVSKSLSVLVKANEDWQVALAVVDDWLKEK